jgi:predicted metalloprotease with PDZ domain
MIGELLWVYEGLTQYLGEVMAARSGAWSPEDYRENLALTVAMLDHRGGRTWRPLEDTAVAAQLLYFAPESWATWRRGTDFYPEGTLLWLTVDTIIRQQSGGQRSLDDFCRQFHGGSSGRAEVLPYTFEDLTASLNQVAPYDWKGFFHRMVDSVTVHAPFGGIEAGGWKLVYNDNMPSLQNFREHVSQTIDLSYSLGVLIKNTSEADHGKIVDVLMNSPAEKAGIGPGMRLVAVQGRKWSPETLRETIRAARQTPSPIELLVQNGDFYKTFVLDYHQGERYPHLERDPSRADLLAQIIHSRSAKAAGDGTSLK